MEEKLLKLFGVEVNSHKGGKNLDGAEGNEGRGCSDEVYMKMEKNVREKSSVSEPENKKYACQFCLKEFGKAQALGGHQNAHKIERLRKRRMQFQEKCDSFHFLPGLPNNYGDLIYCHSLPWFDAFSSFLPDCTLYKESLICFNPLDQNQNLRHNASYVSQFTLLTPHSHFEDTSSRPVVMKPSPSYTSVNDSSLYSQLGLTKKPEMYNSSRKGCKKAREL